MPDLPADYAERVYAGVLGKLIGVYLGRPIEGWTHERIMAELGEIRGYVNARLGVPLIVTDDDIAGTFTFPRALADCGFDPAIGSRQIGEAWLNYIVERRSVLWWGGLGTSTEHTAYLRLRQGVAAPGSGSAALNGRAAAEQIGAQIFIDGWAMMCPGDPARAARLAGEAARVSHDGVAVHAAQLIAAMEALAFVEADIDRLLEGGLAVLPADSPIRGVVADVRRWHASEPDWRAVRERIAAEHPYERYGGTCPIIPNHAVVILALLAGRDRFADAVAIACTAGWDTDCNAGNVGCLMGIRGGLAGLDAGPDFRTPVADRLYVSSADGGRAITDAVQESWRLVEAGHRLAGRAAPPRPKGAARFSFAFPGSVQGVAACGGDAHPLSLRNVAAGAGRALELRYSALAPGRAARAATPTFCDRDGAAMPTYRLLCCPTLYPGQRLRAPASALPANRGVVQARLFVEWFGAGDAVQRLAGPAVPLAPGEARVLAWTVPDLGGGPCWRVGVEIAAGGEGPADGSLLLEALDWSGAPDVVLRRPDGGGGMWARAWVDAASDFSWWWQALRVSQDRGTGLIAQGTREWRDYVVESELVVQLAKRWGLLGRVQGLRRWYGVLFVADDAGGLAGQTVQLVRMHNAPVTLAVAEHAWQAGRPYRVRMKLEGPRLGVWIDQKKVFDCRDAGALALHEGAVGILCEEGTVSTEAVTVRPAALGSTG
jgi:ADP-ribosylglycohydrolase